MSTPCYIGKVKGGKISYISCRHDGEPSYMYNVLKTWTPHLDELLNIGEVSTVYAYPIVTPIVNEKSSYDKVNISTVKKVGCEILEEKPETFIEMFCGDGYPEMPLFFLENGTWYFGYTNSRSGSSIVVPLKTAYEMAQGTTVRDGYVHTFYGKKTTPKRKPQNKFPKLNVRSMF